MWWIQIELFKKASLKYKKIAVKGNEKKQSKKDQRANERQ